MNEEAEDLTHEADVVPTRAQRLQIYRSYIYTLICSIKGNNGNICI